MHVYRFHSCLEKSPDTKNPGEMITGHWNTKFGTGDHYCPVKITGVN